MSGLIERSETYKPFHYPEFVNQAIDHESMFWGEWEASLQRDVNQWQDGTVTPVEKNHITQILRLFTQSDQIVGGSYVDVFLPYFKNNEVRMALLSIANRESTHMRAYALLNDTLGLPESEYKAFLEYEEMADKAEWMQEFHPGEIPYLMGLNVAQTVVNEGVSLFSAFVQLLNYQRPEAGSKMLGMSEIVEWSIRDETKHVEIMSRLFRLFCEEHPEIVTDHFKLSIYSMFREAVALEDRLIDLSFALGGPQALTKEQVKEYIRFIADRRLTQLGLKPNWGIEKNPLPWVDHIVSGDSQKNFFEGRVTDYNHKGMTGEWGW
ncbi:MULTISPECIES: ribonucleotide-diphosphate reductase subunit beta [unclassified Thioalkalivibrio]|uniref:ribonucleotide-diphosphate reductase subunit beta n=1 Tax=unclassified Thioalkalivibrio TaxID=2621013 RepID=UPI00036AC519|nr:MULTISPECIES: ribonucleotide-diphosphate reductase subunit beta [unclassified Thioalkalivibrio]